MSTKLITKGIAIGASVVAASLFISTIPEQQPSISNCRTQPIASTSVKSQLCNALYVAIMKSFSQAARDNLNPGECRTYSNRAREGNLQVNVNCTIENPAISQADAIKIARSLSAHTSLLENGFEYSHKTITPGETIKVEGTPGYINTNYLTYCIQHISYAVRVDKPKSCEQAQALTQPQDIVVNRFAEGEVLTVDPNQKIIYSFAKEGNFNVYLSSFDETVVHEVKEEPQDGSPKKRAIVQVNENAIDGGYCWITLDVYDKKHQEDRIYYSKLIVSGRSRP